MSGGERERQEMETERWENTPKERVREREIINTLFLSAEGTKMGFFRVLLTRTMQGEVGTQCVCVLGGLIGTLAC